MNSCSWCEAMRCVYVCACVYVCVCVCTCMLLYVCVCVLQTYTVPYQELTSGGLFREFSCVQCTYLIHVGHHSDFFRNFHALIYLRCLATNTGAQLIQLTNASSCTVHVEKHLMTYSDAQRPVMIETLFWYWCFSVFMLGYRVWGQREFVLSLRRSRDNHSLYWWCINSFLCGTCIHTYSKWILEMQYCS